MGRDREVDILWEIKIRKCMRGWKHLISGWRLCYVGVSVTHQFKYLQLGATLYCMSVG